METTQQSTSTTLHLSSPLKSTSTTTVQNKENVEPHSHDAFKSAVKLNFSNYLQTNKVPTSLEYATITTKPANSEQKTPTKQKKKRQIADISNYVSPKDRLKKQQRTAESGKKFDIFDESKEVLDSVLLSPPSNSTSTHKRTPRKGETVVEPPTIDEDVLPIDHTSFSGSSTLLPSSVSEEDRVKKMEIDLCNTSADAAQYKNLYLEAKKKIQNLAKEYNSKILQLSHKYNAKVLFERHQTKQIETLSSELKEKETLLQTTERQHVVTEQQNSLLRGKCLELEQLVETWKEKHKEQKDLFSNNFSSYKQLKSEYSKLQDEIKLLKGTTDVSSKDMEILHLREKVSKLESELQIMSTASAAVSSEEYLLLKEQYDILKANYEVIFNEKNNFDKTLSQHVSRVSELEEENIELRSALESAVDEVSRVQSQAVSTLALKEKLSASVEHLTQSNQDLQQKLQEEQLKFKAELNRINEDIRYGEYIERYNSILDENELLQAQIASIDGVKEEINGARSLQEKFSKMVKETAKKLQVSQGKWREIILNMQVKVKEAYSKMTAMTKQNEQIKESNVQLQTSLNTTLEKLRALETEKVPLYEEHIEKLEMELAQAADAIQNLESDLKDSYCGIESLKQELESSNSEKNMILRNLSFREREVLHFAHQVIPSFEKKLQQAQISAFCSNIIANVASRQQQEALHSASVSFSNMNDLNLVYATIHSRLAYLEQKEQKLVQLEDYIQSLTTRYEELKDYSVEERKVYDEAINLFEKELEITTKKYKNAVNDAKSMQDMYEITYSELQKKETLHKRGMFILEERFDEFAKNYVNLFAQQINNMETKLGKALSKLNIAFQKLLQERISLNEQITSLKHHLSQAEQFVSQKNSEHSELQTRNSQNLATIENLHAALQEQQQNNSMLHQEIQNKSLFISNLQLENKAQQDSIQTAHESLQQKEEKIASMQSVLSQTHSTIGAQNSTISQLQIQLEDLQNHTSNLAQEQQRLVSSFQNVSMEKDQLYNQTIILNQDLTQYKTQVESMTSKIEQLSSELNQAVVKNQEHEKQNVELHSLLIQKEAQISFYQGELENKAETVNNCLKELENLQMNYAAQSVNMEVYKKQNTSLKATIDQNIQELDRTRQILTQLEDDYAIAKQQLIKLEQQKEKELHMLLNQIEEVQKDKELLNTELYIMRNELQQATLKLEIAILKNGEESVDSLQLEAKDAQICNLLSRFKAVNELYEKLYSEHNVLKKHYRSFQLQAKQKVASLKTRLEKSQKEADWLDHLVEKLKDALEMHQEDIPNIAMLHFYLLELKKYFSREEPIVLAETSGEEEVLEETDKSFLADQKIPSLVETLGNFDESILSHDLNQTATEIIDFRMEDAQPSFSTDV